MAIYLSISILLLIIIIVIYFYNSLKKLQIRTKEAFSDIDTHLKQRYDLIPSLVETVKGYSKHEKETFEKVTKARSDAIKTDGVKKQAKAENFLTSTIKNLFAVAENYPDLKANQNFLNLQKNLKNIEDQINHARRYYNAVVRDYNTKCETFPSSLIANTFVFKKAEYFELKEPEKERENVGVEI